MNIQWSITVVVSRLKSDVPSWGFPKVKQPIRAAVCLTTIATQPVTPPASVETPHGFDRSPLHIRLGKGTRHRVRTCSCEHSKARAINFWRRRRNDNRKLHKFLERAREYGSELTVVFFLSLLFWKSSHMRWKTWMAFPTSAVSVFFYSLFLFLGRYVKTSDIIVRHVICRFGGANTHWPVF